MCTRPRNEARDKRKAWVERIVNKHDYVRISRSINVPEYVRETQEKYFWVEVSKRD